MVALSNRDSPDTKLLPFPPADLLWVFPDRIIAGETAFIKLLSRRYCLTVLTNLTRVLPLLAIRRSVIRCRDRETFT